MGYKSRVKEAKDAIDGWENKALAAIGLFGEAEAKLRAPVGKYYEDKVGGNLRSSIGHLVDKRKKAVHIGTNVKYAIYVEKGTAPHLILPKTARVLAWVGSDRQRVFAGSVNHPGTRAQPFLTPAIEDNINKIKQIVEAVKFGTD